MQGIEIDLSNFPEKIKARLIEEVQQAKLYAKTKESRAILDRLEALLSGAEQHSKEELVNKLSHLEKYSGLTVLHKALEDTEKDPEFTLVHLATLLMDIRLGFLQKYMVGIPRELEEVVDNYVTSIEAMASIYDCRAVQIIDLVANKLYKKVFHENK